MHQQSLISGKQVADLICDAQLCKKKKKIHLESAVCEICAFGELFRVTLRRNADTSFLVELPAVLKQKPYGLLGRQFSDPCTAVASGR